MFDHYVAVDWAMSNMAIARMTRKSEKITTIECEASIAELKIYLKSLEGKVCLTFEESTSAQWLYVELKELVERLIVCDPYRNRLLSEGAKTDKIDAEKMVKLLRSNLLKEVFHSVDHLIEIRKVVSAYDDLIKSGVRLKNQKAAIYRSVHLTTEDELDTQSTNFVLKGLNKQIELYEEEKTRYVEEFKKITDENIEIKRIKSIPGMGSVLAVKTVSRIIDANRFKNRNSFFSYCGLVKLEKMSGGRSYGKRKSRYCRIMKSIFKISTLSAIYGNNEFAEYYQYLLQHKNMPEHNARNLAARKMASIVYGIMKNRKAYDETQLKKKILIPA
jgi:transposase